MNINLNSDRNTVERHKFGTSVKVDNGALVTSTKPMLAPVNAMLQAFYSRSSKPILERLSEMNSESESDIENKVNEFAVKYGHRSILDCGSITLYIEGVSFLAAKAIQDTPLYSGQETSSRYIDFSKAAIAVDTSISPEEQSLHAAIGNRLIKIYTRVYDFAVNKYINDFEAENGRLANAVETRGIRAKAFDKARGFLPAGCKTQLSFHGSLRDVYAQIEHLYNHPLMEVRDIAEAMRQVFVQDYPSAAWEIKPFIAEACMYYHTLAFDRSATDRMMDAGGVSNVEIIPLSATVHAIKHLSRLKHKNTGSSYSFGSTRVNELLSIFQMYGCIDFGSYRDIHRHRNGTILMPLLEPKYMNDWYTKDLPNDIVNDFLDIVDEIKHQYQMNVEINYGLYTQYIVPMLFQVPLIAQYDLQQMVYVSNLRATPHVHATLRPIAFQMRDALVEWCGGSELLNRIGLLPISPEEIGLKQDQSQNATDVSRRGNHTITDNKGNEIV